MTTPEAAAPLPLEGAPPAAWQSQIRCGCLAMPRTPLRPNYRFADCHSAAVGVHDRPQFAGAIFSASKAPSAAWSGLRRLALRCAAGALRCSGSWPCGRTHFARCTRYVQTSGHKSEHEAREYARGPGTLRFSATPIRPAQAALGALRAQGVLLGAGPGPLHAAPRAVRRWGDCAQPSSAAARGQSGVKRRTGEEAIYGHGPFRAVSRSARQPPRGASSAWNPEQSEGQAVGAPAPHRRRARADKTSADFGFLESAAPKLTFQYERK